MNIQTRRNAALFFLVLLAAAIVPVSPEAAPRGRDVDVDTNNRFSELSARAQRDGRVAVIIQLAVEDDAVPAKSEDRPDRNRRADARERRQRNIARVQDVVADKLGAIPGGLRRFHYVPFAAMAADAQLLQELAAMPEVLDVQEDSVNTADLSSSVPLIGADIARNQGWNGLGQAVAILDTGVDTDHPMLVNNVINEAAGCFSATSAWWARSFCNAALPNCTDSNGNPIYNSACGIGAAEPCGSGCSHGTHVAGIAAGNGSQIGVAPQAGIIPVQVFVKYDYDDDDVEEVVAYDSDIIAGLEHVLDLSGSYDIAAVNMSLGGGVKTTTAVCDSSDAAIKAVIDDLRAVGVATVIAAGNNGSSNGISTPGCISTAVSVGSTTDADVISYFSNESPALTLHAPGSSIRSSVPGTGTATWNGTSMATPHVVGAMALLKQKAADQDVDISVDNMVSALQQTGAEMTGGAYQVPRIQVDAALDEIDATPPTTIIVDNALNSAQVATIAGATSTVNKVYAYGGSALQGTRDAVNSIRFTPNLPQAGNYRVSIIWPTLSRAGSAIDVTVESASGADYQMLNQTTDAGLWQELGVYSFTAGQTGFVELSDAAGGRAIADAVRFEFDGQELAILTTQLADGLEGAAYSQYLAAFGGSGSLNWSIATGSLPAGLSLNAASGEIVGTPTQPGAFTPVVSVQDGSGTVVSQALSLTVLPTLRVSGSIVSVSVDGQGSATPLGDVFLGSSGDSLCDRTDANGDYSCMVAVGWSGSIVPAAPGYSFTPGQIDYPDVGSDQTGQDFTAIAQSETVWVEDDVPAGAVLMSDGDDWSWVATDPVAFSGSAAHRSNIVNGVHWHGFKGATETLPVAEGDTLFTYVYIDPAHPVRQIALHFVTTDRTFARAYWGENIGWAFEDGTAQWMPMGELPAAGQWVRLEVPASPLGLEGKQLDRLFFSLYDGRATFDRSGVTQPAVESVAGVTISGRVSMQNEGAPLSGVAFNGADCSASDFSGDYSCAVPDGWSGSIQPLLAGYSFTPAQIDYPDVGSDQTGQDFTAIAQSETVWVEDDVPAGAVLMSDGDDWSWVATDPMAFSGSAAHRSNIVDGVHWHGFKGATETLPVAGGDTLFTYVYIDPAHPVRQIALHFVTTDRTFARAYWGENIGWAFEDGTAQWMPMGELPAAGQWVRLEVPASPLGLEGKQLDRLFFSLYDGRAAFDRSGVAQSVLP